jgi:predicted nucleic acid-binding protein
MRDKVFVDTNVFVYLYSDSDSAKRECAYSVLNRYDCQISTQVLNEFSNVCIKKWQLPEDRISELIDQICSYCDTAFIFENTIKKALYVHGRYGFAYYDSLMIAAALEQGCKYLISEDMADNQVIDGCLTIQNIFS